MATKNALRRTALRDESGQSLITLALLSLFLLALVAVVLETSLVYFQRRDLQNTADAAALAGAQELNGTAASEAPAITAATDWANKNISDLETLSPVVSDGYTKITVTVTKKADTAFSGWLSFGRPTVTAHAAARVASVNSLIPCVVPLGIQASYYEEAYQNWLDGLDTLTALKVAVQSDDSGSNTGLLNLVQGNTADPIRTGACNVLTPEVQTKPGGTIGDVNNGLTDRLKAAIDNDCYTYEQVTDPANYDRCIPPLFGTGDTIQATAVIRVPILDTDIVGSGASTYTVASAPPPQDSWYLLADFWVDGQATYEDPLNNQWQCQVANDCVIYGRFLFNVPAPLNVWDPSLCPPDPEPCLIDFDPQALIKVVQLIE